MQQPCGSLGYYMNAKLHIKAQASRRISKGQRRIQSCPAIDRPRPNLRFSLRLAEPTLSARGQAPAVAALRLLKLTCRRGERSREKYCPARVGSRTRYTPVHLHQGASDAQSYSGNIDPSHKAALGTEETLEHFGLVFGEDTHTIVGHRDSQTPAASELWYRKVTGG